MPRRLTAALLVMSAYVPTTNAGDVRRNAAVARQRLRELAFATAIYMNDNLGHISDPTLLFPQFVTEPQTFWHPGDSNPAPSTINNSVPNALNSARISFDWECYDGWCAPDHVFIRDNSSANNKGRFVLFVTADGMVESDPPERFSSRDWAERYRVAAYLRRLASLIQIYGNDHQERLPDDLIELWNAGDLVSPRSFWNPGDPDPCPLAITNSAPDAPDSTQVSYSYFGAGHTLNLPHDFVVLADNSPNNNAGYGTFVMFGDWHSEFVPDCPGDVDGDDRVSRRDLRIVRRNLGLANGVNPWDGDADFDGDVDLDDLMVVQTHMGDRCQ